MYEEIRGALCYIGSSLKREQSEKKPSKTCIRKGEKHNERNLKKEISKKKSQKKKHRTPKKLKCRKS